MKFVLSGAQKKQFHQFDLHPQNRHAVGFKTLPPSQKPTKDLSRPKAFSPRRTRASGQCIKCLDPLKEQVGHTLCLLADLGKKDTRETFVFRGNSSNEKKSFWNVTWTHLYQWRQGTEVIHQKCSKQQQPHCETRQQGAKRVRNNVFSQHYNKDAWRQTITQPICLPHVYFKVSLFLAVGDRYLFA